MEMLCYINLQHAQIKHPLIYSFTVSRMHKGKNTV